MRALPARHEIEPMRAIALDHHGDRHALRVRDVAIPEPAPGQLLVRMHAAGAGHWDLLEHEGAFAGRRAQQTVFPLVPGSEGAGVVVCTHPDVTGFREGDRVYGFVGHRNPKMGLHAEFAVLDALFAWHVPARLSLDQAAVVPVDGAVALRGLRDILALRAGESLAVFGASGGMGHMALQLAKHMGARVLAIASGEDGVQLAEQLGADRAVDGRTADLPLEVARFGQTDAALLTAGGDAAASLMAALPSGARIAWPDGVPPPITSRKDLCMDRFGAGYDAALMQSLHALVARGAITPYVGRRVALERIRDAYTALGGHHLGRIVVSTL